MAAAGFLRGRQTLANIGEAYPGDKPSVCRGGSCHGYRGVGYGVCVYVRGLGT